MHIRLRAMTIAAHCCFIFTTQYGMDKPQKTQTTFGVFMGAISPELGKYIDGEQPAITNNKYRSRTGIVELNAGISQEEKKILKHRLPVVKAALEKMLKRPLRTNQVPTIAIVGSGGGYRAMLYTTGALCGAEKIGLLNATTYITALSGSTWAVAPWISSGMPIEKFKDYIQGCASKKFHDLTQDEKILIANAIAVKKTYDQPRTLVDLYADLLANRLLDYFSNSKQMVYLSDQAERVVDGSYPYPIYTAIDGREEIVDGQTWWEFTPHTIGERTNNMHIPTWSFGRKFKNEVSTNDAPEKPLGYLMGLWGSAFAASLDDIREEITRGLVIETPTEKPGFFDKLLGERIIPCEAEVPNYFYKSENLTDRTLAKCKNMQFVDAGLQANLPYPPVSGLCPERAADILIFLDISAGEIGPELKKSAAFAEKHGLLFPLTVSDCDKLTDLDQKTIHIFKNENNPACPVVMYMPRISDKDLWDAHKTKPEFENFGLLGFNLNYETNKGCCKTSQFQYTLEQSTLVMNQAEFNIRANQDTIIKTINWVIDRQAK